MKSEHLVTNLEVEYQKDAKRFEVLKGFLLEDKGAVSYDEAAGKLGVTVAAITSAIHRMRARFSALLVEEVANTVNSPEAVEPELRHLLAALSDGSRRTPADRPRKVFANLLLNTNGQPPLMPESPTPIPSASASKIRRLGLSRNPLSSIQQRKSA